MKIILIILFFILIIIFSRIEIDIRKLEIIKGKIKFLIKLKIYIFKNVLIYSKKIKKKDILKIINFSQIKEHFEKEKKYLHLLPITINTFNLKLEYGIKNVYINVYTYAFINAIVPMILYNYANKNTKIWYQINTDFKRNYLYMKIRTKAEISILMIIKNSISNMYYKVKKAV